MRQALINENADLVAENHVARPVEEARRRLAEDLERHLDLCIAEYSAVGSEIVELVQNPVALLLQHFHRHRRRFWAGLHSEECSGAVDTNEPDFCLAALSDASRRALDERGSPRLGRQ